MASLRFNDDHNKIAYLQKDDHSIGFEAIVDFLASSSIAYAATLNPTIYVTHMKDFWANAYVLEADGVKSIQTTICGKPLNLTPQKTRQHLHFDDAAGITMLTPSEIMESFLRMGYADPQNSLKYKKGKFCAQWRFFVHTMLHCFFQEINKLG